MSDSDFGDYRIRLNERDRICKAIRDGLKTGVIEPRHIDAILKDERGEETFLFRFSQAAKFGFFIQEERKNYPGEKNNLFAFAFSQVGRYERFLTAILERYRRLCSELLVVSRIMEGPRRYTRWEEDERRFYALQAQFELAFQAQVEIESFYIFAKIFLDHIARSLEHFFGPVRGASLDSHDKLVKFLEKYRDALSLDIPIEFVEIASDLKSRIADYRDYQVAHSKLSRPQHITVSRIDQYLLMQISTWNPNATDSVKTHSVSEPLLLLVEVLDRYVGTLFDLVKRNRAKSKFLRSLERDG